MNAAPGVVGAPGAPGAPGLLTRRTLPLYAAAWLPLVVYHFGVAASAPIAAWEAATSAVLTVLPAALAGVVAVRRGERHAGAGHGAGALTVRHGLAAAVYAAGWTLCTALQLVVFAPPEALGTFLARSAPWQWLTGVLLYGVLAGIGHATAVGRRLREREAAAARAELHALRAQLDPHFLFNTLHSLTALARRDPAAVERGLETFGALLRYVLDANRRAPEPPDGVAHVAQQRAGDDDVALADELAFVRDYLALERLRLGDRLRVEERFDDDALECAVPAFTVQPLVENAVRHGLAPRAAGGTLRLSASLDAAGDLVIEVADDGVGADAFDGAGATAAGTPNGVGVASTGLGLALVRRRVAARFGARAHVAVETARGEGFRVRLRLPAEPARPRGAPSARVHRAPPPRPAFDADRRVARTAAVT